MFTDPTNSLPDGTLKFPTINIRSLPLPQIILLAALPDPKSVLVGFPSNTVG